MIRAPTAEEKFNLRLVRRLRDESFGQGVIEVLAVFGLFGAFVAVGVPAWFGYQDGKSDRVAHERLLAAVPAAEVYRTQHGSYAGLDTVDLTRIDPRISMTLVVSSSRPGRFCLTESVGSRVWSLSGPVKRKAKYAAKPSCGRG
jgi:type II secretory pathway pseudopilin PulG